MDTEHWTHTKSGKYMRVPPMDELCDILKTKFINQEELINNLREQIKSLEDENWKDEQLQKMKEEYNQMKVDYNRGFPMTKEESRKAREWMDKHENEKHPLSNERFPRGGAIGGSYQFIFTPTSIGTFGTVKCSCGAEFTFQEEA